MAAVEVTAWRAMVSDLINKYGRATPLLITRASDVSYSTTTLEATETVPNITFNVKGAIVPKGNTDYMRATAALTNLVLTDKQAYILAYDTAGSPYLPMINDIVTADRAYRVVRINEIEIQSQMIGFILDLAV